MVRSRGGGSWTHNNDRNFGMRSGGEDGDKQMGRFVGESLKDPLEMGGESFQTRGINMTTSLLRPYAENLIW